jgi:hypothetical protein
MLVMRKPGHACHAAAAARRQVTRLSIIGYSRRGFVGNYWILSALNIEGDEVAMGNPALGRAPSTSPPAFAEKTARLFEARDGRVYVPSRGRREQDSLQGGAGFQGVFAAEHPLVGVQGQKAPASYDN